MSTQRPVIVFDRKPFPKIVDPNVGPYTLDHLTEAFLAEKKRTPNSVEDIISDIIVPRGHKSPVAGAEPMVPTAQEVQRHAMLHSVEKNYMASWGLWRLSTFDGQERVAKLTAMQVTNIRNGKTIKGWAMYECILSRDREVDFCPTHYASMTPLKADGTPL